MTAILDLKMTMRKAVDEDIISAQYVETFKRIEFIDDALQRKDWFEQMRELKTFYFELYEKIITIEIPEIEIPTPTNIKQTLFSHEDKPENVTIIREEQNASKLHQEIKERIKIEEKLSIRKKTKPIQEEERKKLTRNTHIIRSRGGKSNK
jgi:hypothetical protein